MTPLIEQPYNTLKRRESLFDSERQGQPLSFLFF